MVFALPKSKPQPLGHKTVENCIKRIIGNSFPQAVDSKTIKKRMNRANRINRKSLHALYMFIRFICLFMVLSLPIPKPSLRATRPYMLYDCIETAQSAVVKALQRLLPGQRSQLCMVFMLFLRCIRSYTVSSHLTEGTKP